MSAIGGIINIREMFGVEPLGNWKPVRSLRSTEIWPCITAFIPVTY